MLLLVTRECCARNSRLLTPPVQTLSSDLFSSYPAGVDQSANSPLSNELKITSLYYSETARHLSPTDLKRLNVAEC